MPSVEFNGEPHLYSHWCHIIHLYPSGDLTFSLEIFHSLQPTLCKRCKWRLKNSWKYLVILLLLLVNEKSSMICSVSGASAQTQIQNALLHKNKNTFTLLSRKSTSGTCLFICWRNLITESLITHGQAFLSIVVSLCRAMTPVWMLRAWKKALACPGLQNLYTFTWPPDHSRLFVSIFGSLPELGLCVVCKKKTTENHRIYLGYLTNYYTQEKQILQFIIMCERRLLISQSLSCLDMRERAVKQNVQIRMFMFGYANDKDFNNPVQPDWLYSFVVHIRHICLGRTQTISRFQYELHIALYMCITVNLFYSLYRHFVQLRYAK